MSMKKLKASEEFVAGKNGIGWVGSNFKERLHDLSFTPKQETLQSKELERNMNDKEILKELKPQAVELGDVLFSLSYLSHDGWYLFHVNDRKGTLWAVYAGWDADDGGWNVGALSVESRYRWDDGDQVLSRGFSDPLPSEKTLSDLESLTLEQRVERLEKLFNTELLGN